MKSVEDISKIEKEKDDDYEKEKPSGTLEMKIPILADERKRLLLNPTTFKYGSKAKDVDEWLDEMKFYAWKSRGIPESRRKELWLTLAEKYFRSKCINWEERRNSNENVEDRDMEDQIIKDLHRTGSAFCSGPNSIINQGKLKHLLTDYAQWNPKVGYCQGFNVLGAFILQIMEKEQENSLKIMVYLLEGILPPHYYSESLVGLQIDMAVFRQLMFEHLPNLAKHLQNLEKGQGFDEPPLTNLFTMQWFLTIFCTCLSMPSLLRIWDLIFLEGNEIIFRTSLAIWSIMERYVTKMNSIDDFYGNMGILFQRLCSGSMCDPADLIRMVSRFKPVLNLHVLRVRHKQNSERNKRTNKIIQKEATPSSSKASIYDGSIQQLRRDANKVNIKNIDMSVFKKQYEKLKRRPSLELNTIGLSRKSFDASTNFAVNKLWPINPNNNNNNNNKNNNNNSKPRMNNSNIKKKQIHSNENKKENLFNINKHHKKIDSNLIPKHRHMKSKKSPDIKQFPKPDQLDSLINNKDDTITQSSDSSSTTSLCDNDDNDDDSLYECSSLNYYYSDSIDDTCDNWPNVEIKNSERNTSENVNLILEQIASYSTSNKTNNTIDKIDDFDDLNEIEDNNMQSILDKQEVTMLPDTEKIICDDVKSPKISHNDNDKDDNLIIYEKDVVHEKIDFKEIEKWREKYLKSPPDEDLDSCVLVDDGFEIIEMKENVSTEFNIPIKMPDKILSPPISECKNCTENEKLIETSTVLKAVESSKSSNELVLKIKDVFSLESNFSENKNSTKTFETEVSNNQTDLSRTDKNEPVKQNQSIKIVEEGVTNELFDNLFQNKFSQFAKYAVKNYLEGIHYSKNSFEDDTETTPDTRTYYDVFKIIEENSKVLDSLSKKSNNIIISPAESSDCIQQDSDISDEKNKTSLGKDDDLNDSLSDIKTIKENQMDGSGADEISSSECNSLSLKADTNEIFEKTNIELKIDSVDDIIEQNNLSNRENSEEPKEENLTCNLLNDKNYLKNNRMSRSFEERCEHENELQFLQAKEIAKESSKSLESMELSSDKNLINDFLEIRKSLCEKSECIVNKNEKNTEVDSSQKKEIHKIDENITEEEKILVKPKKTDNYSYNYSNIDKGSNDNESNHVNDSDKKKKKLYADENMDDEKIKDFSNKSKELDEKYDHYWFIEKPEQIEKRRNSLRKIVSPTENLRESLFSSPKSQNELSSPHKDDYHSQDQHLTEVKFRDSDFQERKSSIIRPSSMTEKGLYSTPKSVRIFESPTHTKDNKKLNSEYPEYDNQSNYSCFNDDSNSKNYLNNSKDTNDILSRYGMFNDQYDKQMTKLSPNHDLNKYDGNYFSRKDESDFKERLESIKNTIKFIDDLCDENDKVNRKTSNTSHQTDNSNYTTKSTLYSSEQCSNKNSYKYIDIEFNKKNQISPRHCFKRNSNSYEDINILNDVQQLDKLNKSSNRRNACDDTKECSIDFESIERRKSKSYSNIYFNKN